VGTPSLLWFMERKKCSNHFYIGLVWYQSQNWWVFLPPIFMCINLWQYLFLAC